MEFNTIQLRLRLVWFLVDRHVILNQNIRFQLKDFITFRKWFRSTYLTLNIVFIISNHNYISTYLPKSLSCQRKEQIYNRSVMVCGEFKVQREYRIRNQTMPHNRKPRGLHPLGGWIFQRHAVVSSLCLRK